MKKQKNIFLSAVVIVAVPFMFGTESCDDKMGGVSSTVDENLQNTFTNNPNENNNSYGLTNEEAESLLNLQTNHKLSEKYVRNMVDNFLQMENKNNPNARSGNGSGKIISSVSNMSYSYKRDLPNARGTSEEEVPIYLFNFKNDETDSAGFALVSGDDRIADILIYVENGHLEKVQNIDNPGLALLLSRTPEYIERTIKKVDARRDSLLPIAIAKINAQSPDSLKITLPNAASKNGRINTECDPDYVNVYLESYNSSATYGQSKGSLIPLRWHQRAPYNNLLDTDPECTTSNGRYYTGCTVTAAAMISWYHRKPQGYNYDSMRISPNDLNVGDIDDLMRNIGVGSGASYFCNSAGGQGTALYPEDVVEFWFSARGYSNAYSTGCCGGGGQEYNTNTVISSLNANRPVLIYGCPSDNCGFGVCGGTITCHTFVLDGYYTMTVSNTATYISETCRRGRIITSRRIFTLNTENITRVHTNFGWGVSSAAYCNTGYFNPAGPSYVVSHNIQIWPNMY